MKNKWFDLCVHLLMISCTAIILLFIPLFFLSKDGQWQENSLLENRELAVFPKLNLNNIRNGWNQFQNGSFAKAYRSGLKQFLNSKFQQDLDSAVLDQFPKREKIAWVTKGIDRNLIGTAYLPLNDPAVPADLESSYYVYRSDPFFIQAPVQLTDTIFPIIDQRIQNYQDLIENNPDIRFYAFYLERMAYAPYNPLSPFYPQHDNGLTFQYFLEHKPKTFKVSSMRLKNLQQYQGLFFRTDHHWCIRGAWLAYQIIYDMLAHDFTDISPRLHLKEFRAIEGVEFCGSYSRRTLYPCDPEKFEYAVVDLPPYRTFVDGEEQPYGKMQDYLSGVFNRESRYDHYAEFFGYVTPLVEYRFDNDSSRNLLIIGGSYTQAMQLYLASHYRNTYVVDLREMTDFSFSQFVSEHPVGDVIVIGDVMVYGRDGWLIQP